MLLVLFVLLQIFGNVITIKPKTMNLAVETVIQLDNTDKETNIQIIENVQKFLNKIKSAIDNKRSRRNIETDFLFTDFLYEVVNILKRIDKDDLEDVVVILNNIFKDNLINTKINNVNTRKYLLDKINKMKYSNAKYFRKKLEELANFLRHLDKNEETRKFSSIINNIYKDFPVHVFHNIIKSMKENSRKKSTTELAETINNAINALMKHYINLDENTRRKVERKFNKVIHINDNAIPKYEINVDTISIFGKNANEEKSEDQSQFTSKERKNEEREDYNNKSDNRIVSYKSDSLSSTASNETDSYISNSHEKGTSGDGESLGKSGSASISDSSSESGNTTAMYVNNFIKNLRYIDRDVIFKHLLGLKNDESSKVKKKRRKSSSENRIILTSRHVNADVPEHNPANDKSKPYIDVKTFERELFENRKKKNRREKTTQYMINKKLKDDNKEERINQEKKNHETKLKNKNKINRKNYEKRNGTVSDNVRRQILDDEVRNTTNIENKTSLPINVHTSANHNVTNMEFDKTIDENKTTSIKKEINSTTTTLSLHNTTRARTKKNNVTTLVLPIKSTTTTKSIITTKKTTISTKTKRNSTTVKPSTFSININEILNSTDDEKGQNDAIKKRMLKDLANVFNPTTVSTTAKEFVDPFDDINDDID